MELSILVPVYNTEKYLRRCVDSLLTQTVEDYEVVLVDDGSTDASGSICDEYARENDRVRVIHQENAGSSAARLAGIRASCGAYLGFVDSDDYVESDFYERLLAPVRQNLSIEVSIGGLMKDEMDGSFSYPYQADANIFWEDSMAAMVEMVRGEKFIWNLADKIYARRLFFDQKPLFSYTGQYVEDLYFNAMVLPYARKVAFQPLYGYHYCMNKESITHQDYSLKRLSSIELYVNLMRYFHTNVEIYKVFSANFVVESRSGLRFLQQKMPEKLPQYQRMVRKGMEIACLEAGDKKALDVVLSEPDDYQKWRREEEQRILEFCTSGKGKLYIYGTGIFGQRTAKLLSSWSVDYNGFVETHRGKETCLGHPVKSFNMLSGDEYLVLGVSRKNTQDIEKSLGEKNLHRFPICTYLYCI